MCFKKPLWGKWTFFSREETSQRKYIEIKEKLKEREHNSATFLQDHIAEDIIPRNTVLSIWGCLLCECFPGQVLDRFPLHHLSLPCKPSSPASAQPLTPVSHSLSPLWMALPRLALGATHPFGKQPNFTLIVLWSLKLMLIESQFKVRDPLAGLRFYLVGCFPYC